MAKSEYLTAPAATTRMPSGIPYIIGNEAAERFSFYGMRGILVTFMTEYLLNASGGLEVMKNEPAQAYFHLFVAAAYFFTVPGAIMADGWLGKYRTIICLSLVYCLGHLALAIDETRLGLFLGLTLIALGAGGIKPCVTSHVGDQFGNSNVHLQGKVFGWFYIAINFGSFLSTLLTPWLLEELPALLKTSFPAKSIEFLEPLDRLGPHVAFGVPGILMLLATWVFWLGRRKFVHIPARGWKNVLLSVKGDGGRALLRLIPIFLFVAVFWSLYDQTGAAWVLQAANMDRHWLGIHWLKAQVQAVNPLLILILIPFFSYVGYPLIDRVFKLTPLRKVSIGFFLTVAAFGLSAVIQQMIDRKETPTIVWQLAAYLIITAAEVMVSVTCLEFAYTQAPREMKSFVMSLNLLSVTVGNLFTWLVNWFIENPDKTSKLAGASYYWFFTGVMLAAAILFIPVAWKYREQTYLQEEQPAVT